MRIVHAVALVAFVWLATPSEAQTRAGLSKADVDTINASTQAAVKAALAKDFAAWAAIFVEDGMLNPPNEPSVKGRAAIQAWLSRFPPITAFKLENARIEGRDDLAYVLGTYTLTITPPGAPGPITDSGKFVEIRRRQADGRWLLVVDMFSSDLPAATGPQR
jgi:uncharacterized protein (TIGR02246 family)